jgi:hypothetical protein
MTTHNHPSKVWEGIHSICPAIKPSDLHCLAPPALLRNSAIGESKGQAPSQPIQLRPSPGSPQLRGVSRTANPKIYIYFLIYHRLLPGGNFYLCRLLLPGGISIFFVGLIQRTTICLREPRRRFWSRGALGEQCCGSHVKIIHYLASAGATARERGTPWTASCNGEASSSKNQPRNRMSSPHRQMTPKLRLWRTNLARQTAAKATGVAPLSPPPPHPHPPSPQPTPTPTATRPKSPPPTMLFRLPNIVIYHPPPGEILSDSTCNVLSSGRSVVIPGLKVH